jgi:hypothetical protein
MQAETTQQRAELFSLIAAWQQAQTSLEAAKTYEMELRKRVVAATFDATKTKGTENFDLGKGYVLKCVKKENVKVDAVKINDVLDEIEKVGDFGKFIADRIVKFKPDLSLTEWNALNERAHEGDGNAQKIIALLVPVVEFKPGSPVLEVVEPKLSR